MKSTWNCLNSIPFENISIHLRKVVFNHIQHLDFEVYAQTYMINFHELISLFVYFNTENDSVCLLNFHMLLGISSLTQKIHFSKVSRSISFGKQLFTNHSWLNMICFVIRAATKNYLFHSFTTNSQFKNGNGNDNTISKSDQLIYVLNVVLFCWFHWRKI